MRTSVKEWIARLEATQRSWTGDQRRDPPAFSWDRWSDRPFREERIPGISPFGPETDEDRGSGVILGADPDQRIGGGLGGGRVQFPSLLRARLESRAGMNLYLANDLPGAADAFDAGIRLHQEAGARGFSPDLVACWNGLGLIHQTLTRYEEAEVCYTEACRVLDSHDQSVSAEAIVIHNNWGCLHLLAGRSAKAVESHQCALEMRWLLEPGDNPALAESERNLAISAMEAGDGDTAHRLFHEALRRGDRLGQAWQTKGIELLLCLAKLHMMREELGDAEMILVEAFNRHESMGGAQDSLTPFLLNGLGCIYAEGRCFREARRMFQKALESRQKLVAGAQIDLAVCHANLAVIELELGAVRQSEAALRRAAGLLDGIHQGSPEASHVAWLQKSWEGPAELPSLGARLLGSPAVYRPWPPATLLIEGTAP